MSAIVANTGCRRNTPETVLVVDDDADLRGLEVRALNRVGYTVLQAPGPMEALLLAAATPAIDLLLTDFEMPDANGLELARRFRAVHPAVPVLLVSGSLPEAEVQSEGLDQLAFLAKPFSWDQLVEKVCAVLASQKRPLSATPSASPQSGNGEASRLPE